MSKKEKLELAQKVKAACLQAAREGFKDASVRGLCNEGAVEAAIGSIEQLKIDELVKE